MFRFQKKTSKISRNSSMEGWIRRWRCVGNPRRTPWPWRLETGIRRFPPKRCIKPVVNNGTSTISTGKQDFWTINSFSSRKRVASHSVSPAEKFVKPDLTILIPKFDSQVDRESVMKICWFPKKRPSEKGKSMLWFHKVLTQKRSQVGEKFPAKILFGVFWVGEVYGKKLWHKINRWYIGSWGWWFYWFLGKMPIGRDNPTAKNA